jgi:4-carboxymuconolactone decarboxylase
MSRDRLPPIPPEQWTDEQRRSAEEVMRGPRGALVSPFVPLLRSPELMRHAQRMGEYLRYRNALVPRLSELAILVTARRWLQPVEWAIHAPIAERVGVDPETIRAIGEGRRPLTLRDDEAAVHDFCIELHRDGGISDATWAETIARFGEQGIVDLLGINGYYTFLAMVMNAARTDLPASAGVMPPWLVGALPEVDD